MEIKKQTNKQSYEAPRVRVLKVDVLNPIAQSVTNPDGVVPDYEWGTF